MKSTERASSVASVESLGSSDDSLVPKMDFCGGNYSTFRICVFTLALSHHDSNNHLA